MGAEQQLSDPDPSWCADLQKMQEALREATHDIDTFMGAAGKLELRGYQKMVALRIIDSVRNRLGHTIVVQFPRQSGKNELQAQVEAYLLTIFSGLDAEMVKVSPTWKPQTLNAMRRLQRVLERNMLTWGRWAKESGYIYRVGKARIIFLSGSPGANVVGATASTLLQCDEAQDVVISKWDKDFSPMASSTNATRVFWGTAWTSKTLLARERRAAEEAERRDGIRRVFVIDADQVAREVPAYGEFVREQVARLGRNHPLVKTQFYGEEIDAEGGMFPPRRLALMQGAHPPLESPLPGRIYALLVDVAGQDEGARQGAGAGQGAGANLGAGASQGDECLENPRRDSTALTIIEVDLGPLADPLVNAPGYRVVGRRLWTGTPHSQLYGQLRALVEHWRARYVVIDATGVGTGLSSFLERAFPGRVLPFVFTQSSKSGLGWDFLGVVDTGRFKDYAVELVDGILGQGRGSDGEGRDLTTKGTERNSRSPRENSGGVGDEQGSLQALFFRQALGCQYEVLPGPGKVLRWGVPDGYRDPSNGELLHDDLLVSAALVAVLDGQEWAVSGSALVVPRADPLSEMDREGF